MAETGLLRFSMFSTFTRSVVCVKPREEARMRFIGDEVPGEGKRLVGITVVLSDMSGSSVEVEEVSSTGAISRDAVLFLVDLQRLKLTYIIEQVA
jgi:hypothetical protein